MELILQFGFLSAAVLTVLAAVVIASFWVGWGSQSPAEGKEDARPYMAPSRAERKEKDDASADMAPAPTVKEKKDALAEMAPAPMMTEEVNDTLAMGLCAPVVEGEEKDHEFGKEACSSLVSGEARGVSVEEMSLATGSIDKVDGPMKSEAGDNLGIGELTIEKKDAHLDLPPSTEEREEEEEEEDASVVIAPVSALEIVELTLEELRAYDGSDKGRPLLMAIRGQIYDVSKSRTLYGPGGHYELFGGRDVTRALALMSFDPEDLTSKIDDLKKADLEVLGDWEQKFMDKYPRVGRLTATKSGDRKQHEP